MEVIARINTDIPAGREALRNLQNAREGVTLEYPKPEIISGKEFKPLSEVVEKGWNKLSELYGVDMRKL